jgi:hypothetical protein
LWCDCIHSPPSVDIRNEWSHASFSILFYFVQKENFTFT